MADGAQGTQKWATNRIKHALYLVGWVFKKDNHSTLQANGKPVLVSEYEPGMKGSIFCPECGCPLFRSPEKEDANKRGKNAFYAHQRNTKSDCGLRTKKAEGKRYETEEEAAQAVVDKKLVIVEGFMKTRPVTPDKKAGIYDQTLVEDQEGELANVPISRYRGRKFNLPSKITTIRALCKNFDENLFRYYFFPGAQYAQLLSDAIRDVDTLTGVTQLPILGYGQIVSIYEPGSKPTSTRFVKLKFSFKKGYGDFSIMLSQQEADLHDLNEKSIGRFAMFYGTIAVNGGGLSVKSPGWGEVSLVPKKYEKYLI